MKLLPKLLTFGEGTPRYVVGDGFPSGPETFGLMSWEDWPEAMLREVGVYLRGGTALVLTEAWRAVLPSAW